MSTARDAAIALWQRVVQKLTPTRHRHRMGGDEEDGEEGEGGLDVRGLVLRIVIAIVAIVVIVLLVKLYYRNVEEYPPLLTTPFRGALFDPYPNTSFLPKKPLPTVNRRNGTDGLTLPYSKNNLALLPERVRMPEHNAQNRMSITFWVKPENIAESYAAGATVAEPYAYLLAMNYATTSVSSDPKSTALDPSSFSVLYDSSQNNLIVRIVARTELGNTHEFHLPNALKFQRWQMVTLALDNRDLDVYIDDQLERSFHLGNVPLLGTNRWTLFPGKVPFHGTVTCVRFFNYTLNQYEVNRLHYTPKDVPSMSSLLWWTWMPSTEFSQLFRR